MALNWRWRVLQPHPTLQLMLPRVAWGRKGTRAFGGAGSKLFHQRLRDTVPQAVTVGATEPLSGSMGDIWDSLAITSEPSCVQVQQEISDVKLISRSAPRKTSRVANLTSLALRNKTGEALMSGDASRATTSQQCT